MKHFATLMLCGGALAVPVSAQAPDVALDKMIAAGKSPRELAQYLFDTHGCKDCYTIGHDGKLGFTNKGEERAQGFEGCISSLKAMSIIARVPEEQRSATQRRRAQRFEEFGCAACHRLTPGKLGLTGGGSEAGASPFGLRRGGEVGSRRPRSTALIQQVRCGKARAYCGYRGWLRPLPAFRPRTLPSMDSPERVREDLSVEEFVPCLSPSIASVPESLPDKSGIGNRALDNRSGGVYLATSREPVFEDGECLHGAQELQSNWLAINVAEPRRHTVFAGNVSFD